MVRRANVCTLSIVAHQHKILQLDVLLPPTLVQLVLGGNSALSDEGLTAVTAAHLPALEVLEFRSCGVGAAGFAAAFASMGAFALMASSLVGLLLRETLRKG